MTRPDPVTKRGPQVTSTVLLWSFARLFPPVETPATPTTVIPESIRTPGSVTPLILR